MSKGYIDFFSAKLFYLYALTVMMSNQLISPNVLAQIPILTAPCKLLEPKESTALNVELKAI